MLPPEKSDIETVLAASDLDWSESDPSILGTLFERGLDPGKRAQVGAHYTDRDKIMLLRVVCGRGPNPTVRVFTLNVGRHLGRIGGAPAGVGGPAGPALRPGRRSPCSGDRKTAAGYGTGAPDRERAGDPQARTAGRWRWRERSPP